MLRFEFRRVQACAHTQAHWAGSHSQSCTHCGTASKHGGKCCVHHHHQSHEQHSLGVWELALRGDHQRQQQCCDGSHLACSPPVLLGQHHLEHGWGDAEVGATGSRKLRDGDRTHSPNQIDEFEFFNSMPVEPTNRLKWVYAVGVDCLLSVAGVSKVNFFQFKNRVQ